MTRVVNRAANLVFLLAGLACGSAPAPTQRVVDAKAAVRGAVEVGAERTPQAALHLKMARDQIEKAEALIEDGDNAEAAYILARAQADAELALALTRESQLRSEVERARQRIDELKEDGE
jgi:hypothetical protein